MVRPQRGRGKWKAKFRDEIKKTDFPSSIPAEVWKIDWNVNCQPVGSSSHSVRYLAPYVFKVAISNSRIVKVKDRKVSFTYKKSHSNRRRIMTLDVMEFLRRFLQHALPTGFMKVRYYGFLNPAASVPLDRIRSLIELAYGFEITCCQPTLALDPPPTCPHCGGKLTYLYSVLPFMMVPARPG
ncbi:MAG: transposase [Desulfobacterales bacterium]|nr:transposase [Desulfobacterales bacterium]